jgi:predicted acylesterase/phospholipase RssA
MPPFKMQLAIQGGGAKLTLLMAAASPIQKMINSKRIELTRVVGTSAGAIVASFLAAGVDIEAFRQVLLGGKGRELLKQFQKPGVLGISTMVMTGNPLWSEMAIIDLLTPWFKNAGVTTIADVEKKTGTELQIVSTNLATTDSTIAQSGDPIVHALTNSCGLPFAFRSWRTGPLVDGGITQNFPWQKLAEAPGAVSKHGPVIGIMFDWDPSNKTPNKALGFCSSLLGAAMDSATERARASLGSGQIFSIPARFGTFDFDKALNQGLTTEYDLVQRNSEAWFKDFLEDPEAVRGDIWSGESIATMTKTAQMYKKQHSHHFIKYDRVSMTFRAHGLQNVNDYDIVEYQMEFRTLNEPIYCHKLALSQSDDQNTGFLKSSWVLCDLGKHTNVDVWYVPILDATTPTKREVLAYFDPVLQPNSGPYLLKVKDCVRGLSEPLRERRWDPMLMAMERSNGAIGQVDIVVHLPDGSGSTAHWQPRAGTNPGQSMDKFQLAHYNPDPGYMPLGWQGTNIPANYLFGADLHL